MFTLCHSFAWSHAVHYKLFEQMLWKQNLISFLLVLHHTEKYKSHYCASARVNVSSLSDTNQTVLTFSAALLWTSYSPQFRLFTWKRVFLKVKISSLGFFALSLTKTAFWGHGKTKAKKFRTIFENVNKKNSVNSKKKNNIKFTYDIFLLRIAFLTSLIEMVSTRLTFSPRTVREFFNPRH